MALSGATTVTASIAFAAASAVFGFSAIRIVLIALAKGSVPVSDAILCAGALVALSILAPR